MNNFFFDVPDQPREFLWDDFKKMKWSERREFIKIALLPWPTAKDNHKMWRILSVAILFVILVVYRIIVSMHNPLPLQIFLSTIVFIVFLSQSVIMITTELTKGLKERDRLQRAEMMKQIRNAVDAYGKQMAEKLMKETGRASLDINPISLTAAQLEVIEKHRKQEDSDNLLKAALDGNPRPFMKHDEPEEPQF